MDNKYLVYTRKWRPQRFEDIIGQEQVTEPLKRAIELGRIMQAYLFSGPRGVGKTTTARVFAKAVNCENGPATEPCNKCASCAEITDGSSLDVMEIDGASNRGIDQIRELREKIGFASAKSRYKVYIIDEVHMLTKEAFNALLKTLEEPPKHVIFIFATTDPQNLPPTILSRCQHFRFRRMPVNLIVHNLKIITQGEKTDADEAALYMIAKAADGALRDGQRLLDQAVTYARGAKLTEALAAEMLGEIDSDLLNSLLAAVVTKDIKRAVSTLEAVFDRGVDLRRYLNDVIESFRAMLLIKTVDNKDIISAGEDEYAFLKELASGLSKEQILYMLQRCLDNELKVSKSAMPGIIMEALAADLIFSQGDGEAAVLNIRVPEVKKQSVAAPKMPEQVQAPVVQADTAAGPQEQQGSMLVTEIEEEEKISVLTKDIIEKHWDNIIGKIRSKGEYDEVAQAMESAGVVSFEDPLLLITGENKFFTDRLRKCLDVIKEALKEEFKRDLNLSVYEKAEYNAKYRAQKEVLEEEAKNHPAVKELSKVFKFESVEIKKKGN